MDVSELYSLLGMKEVAILSLQKKIQELQKKIEELEELKELEKE